MKITKKMKCLILFAVLFMLAIWIAWGNTALVLSTYTIKSEKVPELFDGFRIAQLSDLHNAEMGEKNKKLLKMIEDAEPDIIVMTGDLIDSRNTKAEVALEFMKQAVEIAPCYYVTGNHESRIGEAVYQEFEASMIQYGINVLHDEEIVLERDGRSISIVGVDDSNFAKRYGTNVKTDAADTLSALFSESDFKILLSHRPELFQTYVDAEINLVFTGHAHGGQIRLPFIGGLVAPHQGLFPEYDAGLFVEDGTSMVVSRGIGNSAFPVRLNNRPEVVVVELICNSQ